MFEPKAPIFFPPESIPSSPREKGRWGEDRACRYLKDQGWILLGRNLREGHGELDILFRDGNEIVVVEVRLRSVGKVMPPGDSVGPRKLKTLIHTGSKVIRRLGWTGSWRVDLVAITVSSDNSFELEHFQDITSGMMV